MRTATPKPVQLPLLALTPAAPPPIAPDLPVGKYQLIHACGARCGTVASLAYEPGTPLSGYQDEQGLPHEPKRRLLCPKCQSPAAGALTARRLP